jgi:hypothetical protein
MAVGRDRRWTPLRARLFLVAQMRSAGIRIGSYRPLTSSQREEHLDAMAQGRFRVQILRES